MMGGADFRFFLWLEIRNKKGYSVMDRRSKSSPELLDLVMLGYLMALNIHGF